MTKTARKALGMWATGFGGWAAMFLPRAVGAFVVFSVAAFIVWLIPNDKERDTITHHFPTSSSGPGIG